MQTDCAEDAPKKPDADTRPTIRHLVLSGGGTVMLQFYSALKHSHLDGRWAYGNIRSTFTTSAGSIAWLLACFAHHLGWDLVDNFLINRPWHTLCEFPVDAVLKAYGQVGLFGRQLMQDALSPLFRALDVPLDITLAAFHDFAGGIDMHFMTTELQTYSSVDVSHTTHPDWLLLDAIYASAALPVLFQPLILTGPGDSPAVYADGALLCNYPIEQCLKSGAHADEILGVYKLVRDSSATAPATAPPYSNLVAYLADVVAKSVGSNQRFVHMPAEIVCTGESSVMLTALFDLWKSRDLRVQEMEKGREAWRLASPSSEKTPLSEHDD